MSKCLKCKVNINSVNNKCPLCGSVLKETKELSVYPKKVNVLQTSLVKKILLVIGILCSTIILIINKMLTPSIKWAFFVVLQVAIICYVISKVLSGKNKQLKLLFSLNILIYLMAIFWDLYVGFRGWSINYVLPSLCITYGIFVLVLRFVNYFAFRQNSTYIYFNIALGFVPMILLHFDYMKIGTLAYASGMVAFMNLIILIIFDWSDLKDFIVKKFHI